MVEKYEYDAYGKTTIKDASNNVLAESAIGNRFGFTGRELDSETGLYYYRARYYSPTLGRFLQTDPVGYVDSMNLYQYCSNSPNNFVDPFGLCAKDSNKGILPGGYMYPPEDKKEQDRPEIPDPLEEAIKTIKEGLDKLELARKLSYYAEGEVEAEIFIYVSCIRRFFFWTSRCYFNFYRTYYVYLDKIL